VKNSLILLAVALTLAAFAGMMRVKTDVQTMDRERLLASPERLARLVRERGYEKAAPTNIIPLEGPAKVVSPAAPVPLIAVISATQSAQ
jgi:hypothetical protein